MSKKKREMPNHIQVMGKTYTLQVFRIRTKFHNGTPALCDRIPDDMVTRLRDYGDEFMTAYVPEVCLVPE